MQNDRIRDDFFDYRAFVSHTLCQNRLFLGLSSASNARARLSDAYVWPLVHDEAQHFCDSMDSLYGIVISKHHELDNVVKKIRKTLKKMKTRQVELVLQNQDNAFDPFNELARQLHGLLREIYTAFNEHTPEFSEAAVLEALQNKTHDQWHQFANDHIKLHLTPIVRSLILDANNDLESELYKQFWPQSSIGYLLTRKAVVAVGMEDLHDKDLLPIRETQYLLRGMESVVSCWAPLVSKETRQEQIDKVIRAEGFHNRLGFLARLGDEVIS